MPEPAEFILRDLFKRRLGGGLSLAFLLLLIAGIASAYAQGMTLDRIAHIHGLTVDPEQPERLYLATHSGLLLASPDGTAVQVGDSRDDLMSFVADPADPTTFYASGHPPDGGNLGFLVSRDGGAGWQRRSAGANGPVDFHALALSRADPRVIYGLYHDGLRVSRDAGQTWQVPGPLPEDTFDLAVSAQDPERVYAAAQGGLFVSDDGGRSWREATLQRHPATLVYVAPDGRVYAFLFGLGLLAADPPGSAWELRSDRFADRYLLHMAADPLRAEVLHGVADTVAILTSRDGGRSWASYEGHDRESAEVTARGGQLYANLCRACHGDKGVGERPDNRRATDEYGFVAPALDDSAHGWHHSDRDLVRTILEGSPRNPRMLPFKEVLDEGDAENLVAYIKSLWSFRSLACQGARHMGCTH